MECYVIKVLMIMIACVLQASKMGICTREVFRDKVVNGVFFWFSSDIFIEWVLLTSAAKVYNTVTTKDDGTSRMLSIWGCTYFISTNLKWQLSVYKQGGCHKVTVAKNASKCSTLSFSHARTCTCVCVCPYLIDTGNGKFDGVKNNGCCIFLSIFRKQLQSPCF